MGSPKLRFKDEDGKEFPEWVKRDLGNITDINPKNERLPEEFIYIDLESVKDGRFLNEHKIRLENAPSRAQRFLKKNDILFQTVRPYQKNNLFFTKDGIYVASTGYSQIRTKDNPRFIYQTLFTDRFVNNVMIRCTGTSFPAIDAGSLAEIKIYLPSLPEQTKIANFLSAIDDRITHINKKLDLLKTYKKGMMQKIFSQEIRFKDENGKEFSDWKMKKLGDICVTFSGGTPSVANRSFYEGNIPFIRSGDIYKTHADIYISEIGLKNSSAKLVKKGDLLYALYGATSGETSISKINGAINQAILCIRSEFLNLSYLENLLSFKKREIIGTYLQGGQGNLSAEIIKSLIFYFPSLPEQTKIANFLSAIDDKITLVEKQLAATKTYKKGLMQQLFI